jgi:hypothetical protein
VSEVWISCPLCPFIADEQLGVIDLANHARAEHDAQLRTVAGYRAFADVGLHIHLMPRR